MNRSTLSWAFVLVLALVAWRTHWAFEHNVRVGDIIAWSVLFWTALMEAGIWGFAFWWHAHDPFQKHIAEARAELEIKKRDKAAGRLKIEPRQKAF